MSIINSQPLIGASGNQGGYTIAKSLRLRSSASAYLNRTPGTAGNRKTWTWSAWVKRGQFVGGMYQGYVSTSSFTAFGWGGAGGTTLFMQDFVNGSYNLVWETTALFRDTAAWYHVVWAYDSTQASSANALKLYVNGVQQTLGFTAVSGSYTQNRDTFINATNSQQIGTYSNSTFQDGYMADVNFIDGQALAPSSFGSFSGTGGVWQPIAYTGTYGTNGFYLKFTDTTSTATLGNDSSGNGNTWTVNNISLTAGATYDSMTDVPTLTSATAANYCVMNPLKNNGYTLTDGNLTVTVPATSSNYQIFSTFAVSSGKFYFEMTIGTLTGGVGTPIIGVVVDSVALGVNLTGLSSAWLYYGYNGQKFNGSGSAYGSTWGSNAVIGVALDMNAGTITFYLNNTSQGTAFSNLAGNVVMPVIQHDGGTNAYSLNPNFGQRPFTYTPPSGFKALNTYNLPDSTIVAGNKYMDATTYTGTGSTLSVTNAASFKPDLVWVKSRSAATDHKLTDSVRGVTKGLISNTTGAETTDTNGLTAFGSSGFTVGTDTNYNNNTATYVGWQWQAGQGTNTTNTSGSITSTVSVNASAGFSIVTFTSPSSGAFTVGHGLGVAPKFIVTKERDGTLGWITYHASANTTDNYLVLNSTAAISGTAAGAWGTALPTSTVFGMTSGTSVNASKSVVAYCWSEIAGFSKAFSYTGNGSSDGPFVHLGFRPKFVIIKRTDTTSNWYINDSSRDTYNVVGQDLAPNLSDAESSDAPVQDFLSNGFKLRNGSYPSFNASGGTYIGMAFAENPQKLALAR
jgi:hypothetical protein